MTIPLTVIGGYLGAGKTTVLNRLLAEPGGRRLAVVVNDFGDIGIDAELLARSVGGAGDQADRTDVINLANGCVCCTLGDDLGTTLRTLGERRPRPDQVVIEASGVADPAAVSAWSRVPPFTPGGTVVVAAADAVQRQVDDRYVGTEVRRQLAGADLVVAAKTDLVDPERARQTVEWLAASFGRPVVTAIRGDVPADVLLGIDARDLGGESGLGAASTESTPRPGSHASGYDTWSWQHEQPISRAALDSWLAGLPTGLLRAKGIVATDDGRRIVIDVVGDRCETVETPSVGATGGIRFVAIAPAGHLDTGALDHLARITTPPDPACHQGADPE